MPVHPPVVARSIRKDRLRAASGGVHLLEGQLPACVGLELGDRDEGGTAVAVGIAGQGSGETLVVLDAAGVVPECGSGAVEGAAGIGAADVLDGVGAGVRRVVGV